eukprot:1195672-Prorocentrum_minimum.AAC.8
MHSARSHPSVHSWTVEDQTQWIHLESQQQVLRLNVPMDDMLLVAVHQRLRQRRDTHLVIEVPVETQDVGVPEMRLNLNLATKLMLHVTLLQLGLKQHLECHDVLALLFTREVNVAELPPSQRLADIKVHEAPTLGL